MQYNLVKSNGNESLTVVFSDGSVETITPSHEGWWDVLDYLFTDVDNAEDRVKEIVVGKRDIPNQLLQLSERISLEGDKLTFDGDVIDTALSRHIVRIYNEGGDYKPIVNFMELLATNPSNLSRIQLFNWLNAEDFTLTNEGYIVGYKSVQNNENNESHTAGKEKVKVNGQVYVGNIPNPLGAIVEIPRTLVNANRQIGCSIGLHVGTYDYASTFYGGSQSKLLKVLVNPRDVVSVPSDSGDKKMRVSRYKVVEVIDQHIEEAIVDDYWDDYWGYEDSDLDDEDEYYVREEGTW